MKTFIFDFDSTLFPDETMSKILTICLEGHPEKEEKSAEISATCARAMNGEISELQSLQHRLNLVRPTLQDVKNYAKNHRQRFDSRLLKLVQNLQKNHQVIVISGGFKECLDPLLNGIISPENIHANTFPADFFVTGDAALIQPLNKREVLKTLQAKNQIQGDHLTMIGDGITDYWVYESGLVDEFIGAGFYEIRPTVRAKAENFFTNIDDFCAFLEKES